MSWNTILPYKNKNGFQKALAIHTVFQPFTHEGGLTNHHLFSFFLFTLLVELSLLCVCSFYEKNTRNTSHANFDLRVIHVLFEQYLNVLVKGVIVCFGVTLNVWVLGIRAHSANKCTASWCYTFCFCVGEGKSDPTRCNILAGDNVCKSSSPHPTKQKTNRDYLIFFTEHYQTVLVLPYILVGLLIKNGNTLVCFC